MPRYYCDYCDTYLTHDSPSVRKQHNSGYKHKANVRTYYQQFEQQQTQSLIDQRIKEHLSGQAAFGIGAQFGAWRPGMTMRPPILPAPLPIPGQMLPNAAMAPIPRVAVMPRPTGVPAYGNAPVPAQPGAPGAPMHAPNPAQPGAPMQQNGLPGPPLMTNPTSAPGSIVLGSNGAPPGPPQPVFQNPGTSGNFSGNASMPAMPALSSFPSSGGNDPYPATSGTDSFSYARPPN